MRLSTIGQEVLEYIITDGDVAFIYIDIRYGISFLVSTKKMYKSHLKLAFIIKPKQK